METSGLYGSYRPFEINVEFMLVGSFDSKKRTINLKENTPIYFIEPPALKVALRFNLGRTLLLSRDVRILRLASMHIPSSSRAKC
jgi:hypothetical protein